MKQDTRIQKWSSCSRWTESSPHPRFYGCVGTRGAVGWRCPSHISCCTRNKVTWNICFRSHEKIWDVSKRLMLANRDKSEILTVVFYHEPTDRSLQWHSTCQSKSEFSVQRTNIHCTMVFQSCKQIIGVHFKRKHDFNPLGNLAFN